MLSKPIAFGLLALLCIVAAGGGAYIATRHNAAAVPTAQNLASWQPVGQKASAPIATDETEGVVKAPPADANAALATPERTIPEASTPAAASPARVAKSSEAARSMARSSRRVPASQRIEGAKARETRVDRIASAQQRPAAPAPLPDANATDPVAAPPAEAAQVPPSIETAPARAYDELVVSPDSVLGLQMQTTVTSETARVEEPVEARVTRDVRVADKVAIPAGTRVLGSVTQVERGGKIRERARLGIRFHALVLADGTRVPIQTDTIYRDGESPSHESAAKIGGATVGGAILGAILGGGRGAVIGGSIGAAGGTAATMAGARNAAEIRAGSTLTVRLQSPVTISVER